MTRKRTTDSHKRAPRDAPRRLGCPAKGDQRIERLVQPQLEIGRGHQDHLKASGMATTDRLLRLPAKSNVDRAQMRVEATTPNITRPDLPKTAVGTASTAAPILRISPPLTQI